MPFAYESFRNSVPVRRSLDVVQYFGLTNVIGPLVSGCDKTTALLHEPQAYAQVWPYQ